MRFSTKSLFQHFVVNHDNFENMPENIASLLQLGHFNLVLEQNLRLPVQSPSLCEEHLLEPLLPLEALPLGFSFGYPVVVIWCKRLVSPGSARTKTCCRSTPGLGFA